MKNRKGQPICGATINGPKMGRNVVLWRKNCGNRVKNEGDHCRFHGEHYDPRVRR